MPSTAAKTSSSRCEVSPTHFETTRARSTLTRWTPSRPAITSAARVLPVPGSPVNNVLTPCTPANKRLSRQRSSSTGAARAKPAISMTCSWMPGGRIRSSERRRGVIVRATRLARGAVIAVLARRRSSSETGRSATAAAVSATFSTATAMSGSRSTGPASTSIQRRRPSTAAGRHGAAVVTTTGLWVVARARASASGVSGSSRSRGIHRGAPAAATSASRTPSALRSGTTRRGAPPVAAMIRRAVASARPGRADQRPIASAVPHRSAAESWRTTADAPSTGPPGGGSGTHGADSYAGTARTRPGSPSRAATSIGAPRSRSSTPGARRSSWRRSVGAVPLAIRRRWPRNGPNGPSAIRCRCRSSRPSVRTSSNSTLG